MCVFVRVSVSVCVCGCAVGRVHNTGSMCHAVMYCTTCTQCRCYECVTCTMYAMVLCALHTLLFQHQMRNNIRFRSNKL